MGKSCSYDSESLGQYCATVDNIVMAKMLHDYGKPMPGSCYFSADNAYAMVDSLFYRCIDVLFDCETDLEENDDQGEWRFFIPVPKLKELTQKEQETLVKPLLSICCDCHELEFAATLGDGELHVKVSGWYGYSSAALKEYIQFAKNLDEMTKGVSVDGTHA